MKILFLGDVVGSVGRSMVIQHLKQIQEDEKIDFTICNGENAAHGKGITSRIYRQFRDCGIDVVTLGNHAFSKGELLTTMNECENLVRPMNLLPADIGKSVIVKNVCGLKVAVVNLCGVIFLDRIDVTPYECMDKILKTTDADIYFVDLHAEATAEKQTFWHNYRNRVQVVVGTHTHVQTADECVVNGSAYITDVGMCGVYDSILGRDKDEVLAHVVHGEFTHYTPAKGDGMLCGVVINIDETTKKATEIKRIQIRPAN
jgi:2',3'-cyclic-nucleotide 2'-phosphodiesterase